MATNHKPSITKTIKAIKAAIAVYDLGWVPIPLLPDSNVVAVDCEKWLDEMSVNNIRRYWREHPDHGFRFVKSPD
jgi:hypothetical protein